MPNPKLPLEIKKLRGTARRDRANPNAAKPPQGAPQCPSHLGADSRAVWADLVATLDTLGVLHKVDGWAVEAAVEAYIDLRSARKALRERGATTYEITTKAGGSMYRAYPEVAHVEAADKRLQGWLGRFGLTPADRARVSPTPKLERNKFAALGLVPDWEGA